MSISIGAPARANLASNSAGGVFGILPEANGGTGIASFTQGSVVFAGSTTLAQDNANFFWDATNHRLGIKNAAPAFPLDVTGDIAIRPNSSLLRMTINDNVNAIQILKINIVNDVIFGIFGGQDMTIKSHRNINFFDDSEVSTNARVGQGTGFLGRLNQVVWDASNHVGINNASPTAELHIAAGTASANTAPLKLTAGTNLTTPEAGAIEFDGTSLFYTDSGPTRRTLLYSPVNLATQVTGTLPVANGGTGLATLTAHDVLVGNGTGNITLISPSTSGFVLTSNGTGADPTFQASSTGSAITSLTGDVTATGPGAAAATLATVNGNVGSFGSSTSIPSFTVNAKGLITAASGNVVIAPAGTLSGTTLNATVVSSSLTSVGTITTGVWNGTAVDETHGGTNQTSYATGDTLYASASNTLSKRTIGSTGQVLTVSGGVPTWATPASSGLSAVWSGYHGTDSSWSTTSTSLTDPTGDATSTFTELQNVNFGTVTSALSSGNKIPGIVFTPSATGLYQITATFPLSNSLANAISYVQMTDGTTVFIEGQISNLATAGNRYPMSMTGLYNATSTSSKTLKIQMGTSAGGTVTIDGGATVNGLLYWTITKVT